MIEFELRPEPFVGRVGTNKLHPELHRALRRHIGVVVRERDPPWPDSPTEFARLKVILRHEAISAEGFRSQGRVCRLRRRGLNRIRTLAQVASAGHQPGTVALENFRDAGFEWATTAYGKPLVEAAVVALQAGLDTPSLVLLAGAAARFADEEASELAPEVFEELGLDIPLKHSGQAFIAFGRLKAEQFLAAGTSPRGLASEITSLCISSAYENELMDFYSLNEYYLLIEYVCTNRSHKRSASTTRSKLPQ